MHSEALSDAEVGVRNTLAGLSATVSRAQTSTGVNVGAEVASAEVARAGIFSEAILAAIKARFTEYKTVTQR